jgi:AmmeMemoRadiSam system protein B
MKASADECAAAGKALAHAIRETPYDVVIVASTDLSHFERDDVARKLDQLAIDAMLRLDPQGLYQVVLRERISMCGFIPTTIALHAALELGARAAELVKYATSADVSGDYDRVVGYAGLIIS